MRPILARGERPLGACPSARTRLRVEDTGGIHDDSVFADVIGSLELAAGRHRTAANHVFINLVGADAEDDLPGVEGAIASFIQHALDDLRRLKVSCVEVRVGTGSVVALNTSGLRFKIIKSLDCVGREMHPLLNRIQRKRMACQNLSSTTYDIPEIFATVLADMYPGIGDIRDISELSFDAKTKQLVPANRAPGLNDVGMVCWRATLTTHEYPSGRDIIIVANDITHLSGSFSPPEDNVYRAAFDLAVEKGLPCVYISSNSGAQHRSRRGGEGCVPREVDRRRGRFQGLQIHLPERRRLRNSIRQG